MSLINLQTGASAAEEMNLSEAKKIISDLQTRIYKQDLLIRKLNDEANQMQEQYSDPKEIELLKSKLNESENGRKELSETVTRAENKIKDLQQELDRKNKAPARVEYRYEPRCDFCSSDRYESLSLEAEKTKQQADEAREEAEKCRAEAENQRKYFYSLVNNYNFEIDKRVEKIIGRKTRFQRFANWIANLISAINSTFFFAPFLYAVGITVLAVCRNDVVRNDFVTAGKAIGKVFAAMFFGVKWLVLKAAGLSVYAENPTVQKILWWVILILSIIIFIVIILILLFIVAYFILNFCEKFYDELSETFNKAYLAAVLADLGIVMFCGDLIKLKIPINLVGTYFIFLAAFTVLKFFIPIIIEKIRR